MAKWLVGELELDASKYIRGLGASSTLHFAFGSQSCRLTLLAVPGSLQENQSLLA